MSKYPSGCYVYTISVDGVVRYVGKGTNDRLVRHFRRVQSAIAIRAVGGLVRTSNLHHRMIKALLDGQDVVGDVLIEGLSDAEAFQIERNEIEARDGLWNLLSGGEGWTSAEITALWADPSFRSKMAEAAKASWLKPEYRQRVLDGLARAMADETKRKAIDRGLAAGRTPRARARQAAALKATTSTPEGREKMRAAARARWAKHREAIK